MLRYVNIVMPKPEDFEVIKARRPNWEFLQKLPRELHGFTFKEGGSQFRHEYMLAAYENVPARRRLELVYTDETFDYVPVRQVGLQRYRDFRYITRDKDQFEEWITRYIDRLVEETTPTHIPHSHFVLEHKGIFDWHFPDKLPERIGPFEKFIIPQYPLPFLNNCTIILDYADFATGSEVVFLYNQVRNMFYAENKIRYIPNTIHDFDAKKLVDLEELLEERLEPYLRELARQLGYPDVAP